MLQEEEQGLSSTDIDMKALSCEWWEDLEDVQDACGWVRWTSTTTHSEERQPFSRKE
jgi:hypothetical protein